MPRNGALALAILAGVTFFTLPAGAQLSGTYTRSTFTTLYSPISTGGGAIALALGDLNNGTATVALPFDFLFDGTLFPAGTLATVSANGWMTPATVAITPPGSDNINAYFTQPHLWTPWFDDLQVDAVGTNPAGEILFQTQGVVGSRTFTVQWTNVSAWPSVTGGQPPSLHFQVVLHEATNVVEYQYGPLGPGFNDRATASAVLRGASAYIDAWTGSGSAGNGVISTSSWPSRHVRFTPGAVTALAAGSYTAGAGGAFPSLSEALAEVCHRGLAGPVEIVVTDAVNDGTTNIFPIVTGPVPGSSSTNTLTIRGNPGATIVMPRGAATGGFTLGFNFVLTSAGAQIMRPYSLTHATIRDLTLAVEPGATAAVGIELTSVLGVGAQHNTLRDLTVELGGTGVAIGQRSLGTLSAAGASSHNRYLNLQLRSCVNAFRILGNATFPDEDVWLGTDGGTTTIGGPTPGNITAVAVSIGNARDLRVFDCEIRNVATGSAGGAAGIIVNNSTAPGSVPLGIVEISNNRVHDIAGTAAGVGVVRGIAVSLNAHAGSSARIYNNRVWAIESASTATGRMNVGIRLQESGSGTGSTYDVDFNSVRMAPTGVACSNAALETFANGSAVHLRSNVFANFSAAQSAPLAHYVIVTGVPGGIGGAGSISDRNVLHVADPARGFVGSAAAVDHATIADWRAAVSQDANSVAADPAFVSAADLHIAPGVPTPVESRASLFGGAIAWVTHDTDGDPRNPLTPDVGADEGGFVSTDRVVAEPPLAACISGPTPCVTVPVRWHRLDSTPARGYSVTIELSPNLTLCGAQAGSGGYLAPGAAPPPVFAFQPIGGNRWVIDEVTLGTPCGATGTGTLFVLHVGSSGPLTGTGTLRVVSVVARDCPANVPIFVLPGPDATIPIDLVPPVAVANLAAGQQLTGNDTDGTTKIAVTFTAPPDAAGVQVWRRGFGGYPQYDENGGATPVTPATPAAAAGGGWTLTAVTASGQTDEPAARDAWHYVVFSSDGCGNVSAVSNATSGTLNYHLGDAHNTLADCAGDNQVATPDLSFLGAHYGAVLPVNDPLECLDVGPTLDFTASTRPTTDNRLDFEDLITLALNYGQVSAPQMVARPAHDEDRGARTTMSTVTLDAPAAVRAGETFDVRIRVHADGDLHGLATGLAWDAAVVEPLAVASGELFEHAGGVTFSPGPGALDGALLGRRDGALAGEGVFAVVRFRARANGSPSITFDRLEGRDASNRALLFAGAPAPPGPAPVAPPALTELALPRPNPFRDEATLEYALARDGAVTLAIYGLDGRLVRIVEDGARPAGRYRATWNGQDVAGHPVAAGLYFARLSTAQGRFTRTLAVLR